MENWELKTSVSPASVPLIDSRKKRKRVTHTCSSCRTRKIKCDQGKPCAACIKKKIPAHLCIYEDSPFLPTPDSARDTQEAVLILTEENKRLRSQLDLLQRTASPTVSPINAIYHSDFNKFIRRQESLTIKKNRVSYNGPTNWKSLLSRGDEHKEIQDAANAFITNAKKQWRLENDLNRDDYRLTESSTPEDLLNNLSDYIPDYFTFKEYLNIYFNGYWYASMPVVDKDMVLKDFEQIFKRKPDGSNKIEFNITNKTIDYAKISVIIVCLKLAATIKNLANSALDDAEPALYEDEVLVRFVERLLEFSKSLIKVNLYSLQATILIFYLKRVTPTESEGSGDVSNIMVSFKAALNMAIMLGLNRSISKLYAHETPTVIRVYTVIWCLLLAFDASLSFAQGTPLGIADDGIDFDELDMTNSNVQLIMCMRDAARVMNSAKSSTVGEVIQSIKKIEDFVNEGSLSETILEMKDIDGYVSNFEIADQIEQRLITCYALHGIYEVLYLSLDPGDPSREEFYNGVVKFGTITSTHLIELLSGLTVKNLNSIPNLSPQAYKEKLYHVVELSSSLTAFSRIVFLKVFVTLCYSIQDRIKEGYDDEVSESVSKMRIIEFENFALKDTTSPLAKSIRSPSVLHGFLSLICKHLLNLHNASFGKVFGFDFSLYAVISLFKYFNNFLTKFLTKDQLESTLNNPTPSISYVLGSSETTQEGKPSLTKGSKPSAKRIVSSEQETNWQNPVSLIYEDGTQFLNPSYNNGFLHLPTAHYRAANSYNETSEHSQPPNLASFDPDRNSFFEWNNKIVDDLFKNILTNDEIFTLENPMQSYRWVNSFDLGSSLQGGIPPGSNINNEILHNQYR